MNVTKNQESNSLLQRTYVQKSKVFLLPLTGMKKDPVYRPINTYVASPDLVSNDYPEGIEPEDRILIVNYPKTYKEESEKLKEIAAQKMNDKSIKNTDSSWTNFELEHILSNSMFMAVHETEEEYIYTFDMTTWKYDWDNFLKGRYSLLSQAAKDRIVNYRWETLRATERRKLLSYLYPNKEEYIAEISKQLGVSREQLKEVKELCNKPDIKLETFKCGLNVNLNKNPEMDGSRDKD